jgi:ADP-ribosylglycohydrolase
MKRKDINPPAVLIGMAIGDALGMPYETCKPDDPRLRAWNGQYEGSDYHKLQAGQFTAATQMAVALTTSIVLASGYKSDLAAAAYMDWYRRAPRGVGGTIKRAMERLITKESHTHSGRYEPGETWIDNGVSMRIAPLGALYAHTSPPSKLLMAVEEDAAITHNHPDAIYAASAVALAVAHATRERRTGVLGTVLQILASTPARTRAPRLMHRLSELLLELTRGTLPAELFDADDAIGISAMALYIADATGSYEDAVATAIRMGGDTDTRAAIVGAIVGAAYGLEAIPEPWFQGVEERKQLMLLDAALATHATMTGGPK